MYRTSALISSLSLLAGVSAQQIGTNTAEVHPPLSWQSCTTAGGCVTQAGYVVLDANWRWVHTTVGYTNCYTGNTWDTTICPDPVTCAQSCAVDGADYSGTYGITTSGNALTLKFVTTGANKNVGSRNYLMNTANTAYQEFNLLNKEFTFTVDVSTLPCGLNGALYFSQMSADGGSGAFPNNKAGAPYGTGYCDSQCPHDIKFINGAANLLNWTASAGNPNSGTGMYGTCCNEMDIWEGNSISEAYTPHPCSVTGQTECSGTECSTYCDQAGCDFNSYRMGDTTFYGPGMVIDTTKPITAVTQFLTSDNTSTGTLVEIRRFYVQGGVTYANSYSNIPGLVGYNSITDAFCAAQKAAVGDTNTFANEGGLAVMGKALEASVLVLSIWDDTAVSMLWLDSDYPTTASPTAPGVARGTCSTSSGKPTDVEANSPNAQVIYSNIKFGDIGSTFSETNIVYQPGGPSGSTTTTKSASTTTKSATTTTTTTHSPTTTTTTTTHSPTTTTTTTTTTTRLTTTTTTTSNGASQTHWGQCGGQYYSGPTSCQSPYTCTFSNPYYSQCL